MTATAYASAPRPPPVVVGGGGVVVGAGGRRPSTAAPPLPPTGAARGGGTIALPSSVAPPARSVPGSVVPGVATTPPTTTAVVPPSAHHLRPSPLPASSQPQQQQRAACLERSKLLWHCDELEIDRWIRSIHCLFPHRPKRRVDGNGNVVKEFEWKEPTTSGAGGGEDAAVAVVVPLTPAERDASKLRHKSVQIELQRKDDASYLKDVSDANVLLSNLTGALRSASVDPNASAGGGGNDEEEGGGKRIKTGPSTFSRSDGGPAAGGPKRDAYGILDPSFSRGDDVVHVPGAVIGRLTLGGLTNALAGVPGGIVDVDDPRGAVPLPSFLSSVSDDGKESEVDPLDVPIPAASNLTLRRLLRKSKSVHRAIEARVEMDMLNSTPDRIVEMLCPDVSSSSEISSIRRRIYDTVVLGRGTNSSLNAAALEGGEDLPVAARTGVHDAEKFQKCKVCGNNDQSLFVMDRKNGDLICTNCGTVATESLMHEGSQFRKFEGEADRNHHGDVANPLYSNAHNMSTTLGGTGFATGAGAGGFGSGYGGGKNLENVLRNAHAYTEMNISQFGKEEKKTRVGYKDRQKKDAFVKMAHVGDALGLHEAVVQRAKELFAGFRDDRELVQQFKGVVAACLCEAFDQLSRDGRQILKKRQTGEESEGEEEEEEDVAEGGGTEGGTKRKRNARAARRNDLHSARLAGKGGIEIGDGKAAAGSSGAAAGDADDGDAASAARRHPAPGSAEARPAASWDLDDCRSFLLEASRSVARQWSDARKVKIDSAEKARAVNRIPKGTLDELEGRLVEHTLTLCDFLEGEVKGGPGSDGRGAAGAAGGGKQRVRTPRVKDMSTLSIRWQHEHERGSGGKGGVGNSGRSTLGTKRGERPGEGKTAGQVLLLMTSKKLGALLKDPMAGEAFHRELRALMGRQEARKKKVWSDEAAVTRFKQMQRKPWLMARAQLG